MARRDLPDHRDEVARALAAKGVAALCAELGIERSTTEKGKFICPRHKGGSLSVRVARDGLVQVKCFAGCELGDVFGLVAEARGLDVRRDFRRVLVEAAIVASAWAVVEDLERRTVTAEERRARPAPAPPVTTQRSEDVRALDVDTFDRVVAAVLERSPLDELATEYLEGRRMLDLARAAGWGALPASLPAQAAIVAELVARFGEDVARRSGLLVADDGAPRLVWRDHRLLIPWRVPSVDGLVHTLQRRLLRPTSRPSEPKYVFPSGHGRPAWPYLLVEDLEDMTDATAVAFVEGAPDVLALRWLARAEGRDVLVLGVPGVENWRPSWARFADGRPVLVALDADRAGEAKATAMHADLRGATSWKRWRPKSGKDWGDELAEVRTA